MGEVHDRPIIALVSHPAVSEHADIPDGMPGRELIVAGLDDLRAGRETVEAMLVATGAPRLRACGIDVPGGDRPDSGLRMYRLLGERDAANASQHVQRAAPALELVPGVAGAACAPKPPLNARLHCSLSSVAQPAARGCM